MRPAERHITLLSRLLMAWTFLYSASHQVLVPNFSVVGFLNSTKTFHGLFVLFTTLPSPRLPVSSSRGGIR